MGSNMDFKHKPEYKFINLEGLDENAQSEIKAILKSEIAPDVLKLPWNNGDCASNNSVSTDQSETQNQWQHYDETAGMYEIQDTQSALLAQSTLPRTAIVPHSYVQVQYQEWPNTNPYRSYVSYGGPVQYQPQQTADVRLGPSIRDSRRGTNRSHKNDYNHRMVNTNEIQQTYIQQTIQPNPYTPVTGLCHSPSGIPYIAGYPVPTTPSHPVAGRPVYMTTQYNQQAIYTSNHPQYAYSPLQHHSPTNAKQHQRLQNHQHYYNSEQTKIHSNSQKSERKYHDMNQSSRISNNTSTNSNNNNNTNEYVNKKKYSGSKTGPANGHIVKYSTNELKIMEKNDKLDNDDDKIIVKNSCVTAVATSTAVTVPIPAADDAVVVVVAEKVNNIVDKKNNVEINDDGKDKVVVIVDKVEKPKEEKIVEEIVNNVTPTSSISVPTSTSSTTSITATTPTTTTTTTTTNNNNNSNNVNIPVSVVVVESNEQLPVNSVPVASPITVNSAPAPRSFASILKKNTTDQPLINDTSKLRPVVAVAETNKTDNTTNSITTATTTTQNDSTKRQNRSSIGDVYSGIKGTFENSINDCKKSNAHNDLHSLNDPNQYRMGEFLLSYQMDKQTVSLVPRGLTNRSNYCYINSILQALLACPPFYNLLRALSQNKTPLKNSPTPLIDNMIKFVNEFSPLPPGARLPRKDLRAQKRGEEIAVDIQGGTAFEPSYVYTMLKNTSCSNVFPIEGRQEDAEEFLSCLLNGISDEMLELMKQVSDDQTSTPTPVEPAVNLNSSDEEWKVMGPRNKGSITRCTEIGRTPLSDIFRGQLRSRIHRQGDQYSDNVQPFFTLQLDVEKAESVEGALEILVGKDQVEGMLCSKTKQQIQAWKQVTLDELPVILILHLKWFNYKLDGCSKIFKNVAYTIDLKVDGKILTTNVAKKLNGKQKQYKLFAVTYHDGKEATKGHYVTDAFHVSYGSWVRYDDSSIKSVTEHDVLHPATPRVPYLLYYRRCDTIGNNQPPNTIRTR